MTIIDTLTKRNEVFATRQFVADLPIRPALGTMIIRSYMLMPSSKIQLGDAAITQCLETC